MALLLFFAGAITMFELDRLRSDAREVIAASMRSTEFATRMLNALQIENSSVLRMMSTGTQAPDSMFRVGRDIFNRALSEATGTIRDRTELDAVYSANDYYNEVIATQLSDEVSPGAGHRPLSTYLEAYYNLDSAIKNYMTSPEGSLVSRTEMLEDNAYKTMTPSILTLLAAILIVLMLYFFIDLYYVKPVQKLRKSLDGYINARIPFQAEFEGGDELRRIRDDIEILISRTKKEQ